MDKADVVADWLRTEFVRTEGGDKFNALHALGNLSLVKRNFPAAEKHFQDAIKADRRFPAWGWLGLARAQLYQRHLNSAAKYAQKALESVAQSVPNHQYFRKANSYLILTATAAANKDRPAAERFIQKLSAALPFAATPLRLNDSDIFIATTELHKAGFDDLVSRLPPSSPPPSHIGIVKQ